MAARVVEGLVTASRDSAGHLRDRSARAPCCCAGALGTVAVCEMASLPSASPGIAHLCRARRGLGPRRMGTGWGPQAGLGCTPFPLWPISRASLLQGDPSRAEFSCSETPGPKGTETSASAGYSVPRGPGASGPEPQWPHCGRGCDDSARPSTHLPTGLQTAGGCSREVSITPPLHPHQGWVTVLCLRAHPCPPWSVLTTVAARGCQNRTGTFTKKETLRVSLT